MIILVYFFRFEPSKVSSSLCYNIKDIRAEFQTPFLPDFTLAVYSQLKASR